MVPQGADIVALQLDETTLKSMIEFHRPCYGVATDSHLATCATIG